MHVDVYLPLAFSALFGLCAPHLARRLPPALAAWLLTLGSAVCAVGFTAGLGFLAWTLVGVTPDIAASAGWSAQVLRTDSQVPLPVAVIALAVLTVIASRLAVTSWARGRAVAEGYRLAATLPSVGELVVVDDDQVPACAVPGRPGRAGRIVIPSGLMRRLDPDQRRALLDHERAHLRHHHYLHRLAADIAAAANPLLARVPAATELATERWADEEAAHRSPRAGVASALLLAAGAAPSRALPAALAAVGSHVTARLTALAAPAPRPAAWRVTALVALATATAVATVLAAHDVERLSEIAGQAYRLTHG